MGIAEALQIVIDLARQAPIENDRKAERDLACDIMEDLAVNEYCDD